MTVFSVNILIIKTNIYYLGIQLYYVGIMCAHNFRIDDVEIYYLYIGIMYNIFIKVPKGLLSIIIL